MHKEGNVNPQTPGQCVEGKGLWVGGDLAQDLKKAFAGQFGALIEGDCASSAKDDLT